MANNSLINLDFTSGIHDADLNYNFNLIDEWIRRERLRTGGAGVVNGFNFTKDLPNWNINISSGELINKNGEQILVDATSIYAGPPTYSVMQETLTVDQDGKINLKFPVYANSIQAQVLYNPPDHNIKPKDSEFNIKIKDTTQSVNYQSIVSNIIYVDSSMYNIEVTVTYQYSNDRIDAVFIDKIGKNFLYQKGIISTSPSSPDIKQYAENYYLLGFAYWHVNTTVDVEFITVGRPYTHIFVDNDTDILYINGSPYKQSKEIYFIKPDSPELQDFWYDSDSNTLYVYKASNGTTGWYAVNDKSDMPIRSTYMYTEENFPEDDQTFLFPDSNIDLKYTPGLNELSIIIDNAPLMNDQFTEVIQKGNYDYENIGIGFKLIQPLDRVTPVQVDVIHAVRAVPQNETFQRMAIFTYENYIIYSSTSYPTRIFTIPEAEYEIGENQLEIWKNGLRLINGVDFSELTSSQEITTDNDKGSLSNYFKINIDLSNNDKIYYKITRHMWSYENLQKVVDGIEKTANDAKEIADTTKEEIDTVVDNVNKQLSGVENDINDLKNSIPNQASFIQKGTGNVSIDYLDSNTKSKLFSKSFNGLYTANALTNISNIKSTDFILISYSSSTINRILINGTDYTLQDDANSLNVILNSQLVSSSASIYVTGISIGV